MQNVRIVAVETEIAEQVRATLKAPVYVGNRRPLRAHNRKAIRQS
jgi:hypothetical protein